MATLFSDNKRVVSGIKPTGLTHLGHYRGVLKNWIELQHQYECYFFVADWHALSTHYDTPEIIGDHVWSMVIDWLACGVNYGSTTLFIQSWVPEHAELYLLLSMSTPLAWLERVPSYKDLQEGFREKELATHGFLGAPLLHAADILAYRADYAPVGEDQITHIELTREVARRFNFLYGREENYEQLAHNAQKKMGKKNSLLYTKLRTHYQQEGCHESLETAKALLDSQQNLSHGDKERLLGYLEGGGKIILPEPDVLLTDNAKLPGLDGQKMSKSMGNTINLRDTPEEVEKKILTMPTDPARVKRTDCGNPDKCPVWQLHQSYTDDSTHAWVQHGCRSAGIGCVDCKRPVIDAVNKELKPIQRAIFEYEQDKGLVKRIVAEGSEKARDIAVDTLSEVKQAMEIGY